MCVLHAGRSDALTHSRSESHGVSTVSSRERERVWTSQATFNRRVQFKPNFELSVLFVLFVPLYGKLRNRFWTRTSAADPAYKPDQQWAMKVSPEPSRSVQVDYVVVRAFHFYQIYIETFDSKEAHRDQYAE